MSGKINKQSNPLVVKGREFVHSVPYTMSANATKLTTLLISMIRENDDNFKRYSVIAKELGDLIDIEVNTIMLRRLRKELRGFEFIYMDGKYERSLGLFTYIDFHTETYSLSVQFHEDMRKLLIDFSEKGFLKYESVNTLSLHSHYLMRLYEICKDKLECSYITRNSTIFKLDIDEFRTLVKLDKVNAKGQYTYKYSVLKDRVINEAVKQFKATTDIEISYKEIKESRRVAFWEIIVKRTKEAPKKKERHENFLPHLAFKEAFLNSVTLYPDEYGEEMVYKIDDELWLIQQETGIFLCDEDLKLFSVEESHEKWREVFANMEDVVSDEWIKKNEFKWRVR